MSAASEATHCCWPGCRKPRGKIYPEVPMCSAHAQVVHDQVHGVLNPQRSIRQRTQLTRHGTIYYLLLDDVVKIGHTTDMAGRMTAYPPTAILLAAHPGTMGEELELHRELAPHRAAKREWYHANEEIRALIEAIRPAITPMDLGNWCKQAERQPIPRWSVSMPASQLFPEPGPDAELQADDYQRPLPKPAINRPAPIARHAEPSTQA